ncbi:unnamed protein product [Cylindrotheca closterium]|uniref:HSF-type DNA-binding domain-containing protein n=1 Tax=Cylindrotheca closterium TaxID=2856 RepID=A0AAD2FG09_9STRA|nr:unnamed protein product [Cylindrotheca closterium]
MTRVKKGREVMFPGKLMSILESAEAEKYDHIVAWCPNGSAFTVREKDLFIQQICSAHFKLTRWRSFAKQLNDWGFLRDRKRNSSTFSHPIFRRGDPESLTRMIRTDSKQKRESCGRTSVNKIAGRDCGIPLTSEESQKEESNESSFSDEDGEGSIDTETESASCTDEESEAGEPTSPFRAISAVFSESYITEEDCPMDLELGIHQLYQDAGEIVTEAFSSNRPSEAESTRKNSEKSLCEGKVGSEWVCVGDDSLILSDLGTGQAI